MEEINNRDQLYKKATVAPIEVIAILDSDFESNPLISIHKIVNNYNKKLSEGIINKKILNGLYTVLCYEYNLPEADPVFPLDFDKNFFSNILKLITANHEKDSEDLIRPLYEILVLQLKLYCDVLEVTNLLKNFIEIYPKDSEIFYKILECFIDALYLKHLSSEILEDKLIVTELKIFFTKIEKKDWKIFISLVIKILRVFNEVSILPQLWEMILNDTNDWEKSLTLLNILIDYILAISSEEILSLNCKFCSLETTWQLIFKGLMSSVEQNRKQGLYIMKKILDFLEKHPAKSTKLIPIINCPGYKKNPAIKELKKKFFLILESLEEKQGHLVTPVLAHLESLIKFHFDHLNCLNCLDSKWLQCIFTRALNHKTNGVIKLGLTILLKIDPVIYTQDLIELLITGLNTTFIYDNQTSEPEPVVVKELAELFVRAEYSEVLLINQFILQAGEINWTPIPLFYVISSLYKAGHMINSPVKSNLWTGDQLNSLETILDKFLHSQPLSLRNILRDFIADAIFKFAEEPIPLEVLARIYYSITRNCLINSSLSCSALRMYLKDKLTSEAAENYIKSANLSSEVDIKSFAQMTAFLYDAKKIFKSSTCLSLKKFYEIYNSLINIESRPYADKDNRLKIISLFNWFFYYLRKYCSSKDQEFISNTFLPHIKSVLAFIIKNLNHSSEEIYFIYFICFKNITKFIKNNTIFREYLNSINSSALNSIVQNEVTNTKLLFTLTVIKSCVEYLETPNLEGVKSVMELCKRPLSSENRISEERRVTFDCYKLIGEIFLLLVSYSVDIIEDYEEILLSLVKLIDWGKECVINSVIKLLPCLLTKKKINMEKNMDVVKCLVEACWVNLWDMNRDDEFWNACKQFIECLMEINKFVPLEVREYIYKINFKSEDISGLRNLLWSKFWLLGEEIINYWDVIMQSFIETNIGRERKIEIQAQVFLFNNFDVKYCYDVNFCGKNDIRVYVETLFRAESVFLIIEALKSNQKSVSEKEDDIVEMLLSILEAHRNKRYYNDSNLHKIKHRVMQLLLVIASIHGLKEENLIKIHDTIGELIIVESNQPTVRMMQEWLLIKIYLDTPKLLEKLWGLLERAKEERPGSITSIASIIYHVSRNFSGEIQQLFVKDATSQLLSCSFSQQFVVRLYCQTVLAKLFEMIPSSSVCNYDILKKSIDESLLRGNMYKNSMKLCEDFYFTKFNPVKNFTLTTIFYDVPRLLNMSKDEWISPKIFEHLSSVYKLNNIDAQNFVNNEYTLENISPSQMTKTRCQELDEEEINLENSDDVQKKIMPWKSMIPLEEDLSGTLRRLKLADDTGLIVVASLIDSMANLGGLARTAEIFCAKQLVLSSMKYVENKEFQMLSVSAEKWVQITEVKAHELRDYLLEKSSLGWKIVGAEQTVNSVCLTDVKFDKKTVLVLGNEKIGMPANLIPLMDVCIEIPQAGVVRSLNVHVTGAICMWHYAQQYIFS
ncbi:uncharacterized protein LOC123259258 [Cotesia glomerata]|uniref:tRNA/rRNA methyltransferase SpoU type domain-containing protein n=1 Tax=Cotesia glomerata TaxID=32391 RepID=A0AAV7I0F0_COTGL|nr:uncharacterized protein LOC123259258 [Cotesia glomerata]KAH0539284.1 hypothetical protein KQX54_003577 [Cotesia glomerata]